MDVGESNRCEEVEEREGEGFVERRGKRGCERAEKGGVWFGGFSWEWPA